MSFAEERLYSPLYLRVYLSMSRRHKTRFFLKMLEWETALRPPVRRKTCYWAASTWCSASNPWEVIASDSSFFTWSSSFRPSSKSSLISSFISFPSTVWNMCWLHFIWFLRDVVGNICHPTYNTSTYITLTRITRTFSQAVSVSGGSPVIGFYWNSCLNTRSIFIKVGVQNRYNTNLIPLGTYNFSSKRINRKFLFHIPQRLPPNSTRWPSQATETSWLLVPALLNMQSWTIRKWIGSITSSYPWIHAISEKKKKKKTVKWMKLIEHSTIFISQLKNEWA